MKISFTFKVLFLRTIELLRIVQHQAGGSFYLCLFLLVLHRLKLQENHQFVPWHSLMFPWLSAISQGSFLPPLMWDHAGVGGGLLSVSAPPPPHMYWHNRRKIDCSDVEKEEDLKKNKKQTLPARLETPKWSGWGSTEQPLNLISLWKC